MIDLSPGVKSKLQAQSRKLCFLANRGSWLRVKILFYAMDRMRRT